MTVFSSTWTDVKPWDRTLPATIADNMMTVSGMLLRVSKIFYDNSGCSVEFVVTASPFGGLNGFSTGMHRGTHEYIAQGDCLKSLEAEVARAYFGKLP